VWYVTRRALVLVNAMQCTVLPHITASVLINDDERGPHHDYEVWLQELAPHAPVSQYQHNRTGEDACGHALSSCAMPEGRAETTHHLTINAALNGTRPSIVGEHATCQVTEPLQYDLSYMQHQTGLEVDGAGHAVADSTSRVGLAVLPYLPDDGRPSVCQATIGV
jgi:hypothetical protein